MAEPRPTVAHVAWGIWLLLTAGLVTAVAYAWPLTIGGGALSVLIAAWLVSAAYVLSRSIGWPNPGRDR